jgi:hypothetical protein
MLDSVRVRLTVWYTLALALVLILLAILSYVLYARNSSRRTDSSLVELADAFATTFRVELKDQDGPDPAKEAARAAILEHRFRDTVFVVLDSTGNVVLSTRIFLQRVRRWNESRQPFLPRNPFAILRPIQIPRSGRCARCEQHRISFAVMRSVLR